MTTKARWHGETVLLEVVDTLNFAIPQVQFSVRSAGRIRFADAAVGARIAFVRVRGARTPQQLILGVRYPFSGPVGRRSRENFQTRDITMLGDAAPLALQLLLLETRTVADRLPAAERGAVSREMAGPRGTISWA